MPDAAVYIIKPLGCGQAGTQSVAAVSGSTIAFASLAATTMTATCTDMPLGPVEMSQVDVWNVCYAAADSGGEFVSHIVTSQPYLGPTGVGLAFDSSGTATVAYTGIGSGGSAPPKQTCGSNQLYVTSFKNGSFTTPLQISNGSMSNGEIMSMAGNCNQNICNEGDTTGFWPAVGFDPGGNAFIPFRDEHFGFAVDDFAKSDVELAEQTGGTYSVLTVDVSRGGGTYNRIAFSPSGLPAVVQFDEKGQSPGVYIDRQTKSDSFSAQQAPGVWVAAQLTTGQVNPILGFAISSSGVYGVAYNDQQSGILHYIESSDGTNWSSPVEIDVNGDTGQYPSLAFDANNNPAIAYYRRNAQIQATSCDPSSDGLLLARRTGTHWGSEVIHADPSITDGAYPALAFVNGKAFIAFQETSTDAISKVTTSTWWVAEEP